MESDLRSRYFNTLGFDRDSPLRKDALERAHKLRTFEIEHYWKRATYFWGFQVAIFAAFGLVWKEQGNATTEWSPLAAALGGLGFLTAIANVLSARGSRFWQENWEKHIDMLEDKAEGRLYKTVWLKDGKRSYSVSRVNENLSYCFVGFWMLATAFVSLKYMKNFNCVIISSWILLPIAAATILGFWRLVRQASDFYGTRPKADGSHDYGRRYEKNRRPIDQEFIRRYAPDEFPADNADSATQKWP
jgi:hypothetical protein